MKIDIYEDGISYITDEVSTVSVNESNLNEENRIKFVTDLAAISRGKDESFNPPSRYLKLLEEAAPTYVNITNSKLHNSEIKSSPSRPIEFLPIVLKYKVLNSNGLIELLDTSDMPLKSKEESEELNEMIFTLEVFNNLLGRHSYIEDGFIYTNMRACINAGIPYDMIPYNTVEELKNFKAIKANIPMFVWAQVPNTHTAISKEAQSDRFANRDEYWLPNNLREKVYYYKTKVMGNYDKPIYESLTNELLGLRDFTQAPYLLIYGSQSSDFKATQNDIQEYFKELGYKAEIYQRAMYYFKYKKVVMTGWFNDPKVWKHLFLERSIVPAYNKNWTQEQSKVFVASIKTIILGDKDVKDSFN